MLSIYLSLPLPLKEEFSLNKNCGICFIKGRKLIRVTQSLLYVNLGSARKGLLFLFLKKLKIIFDHLKNTLIKLSMLNV